jgi:hypothetical protein
VEEFGLDGPTAMAFGPGGDLYISSDSTVDRVLRFDGATGSPEGAFAENGVSRPRGLVFGPDGDLFLSNQGTGSVDRFDGKSGAFAGTFARVEGLNSPDKLAFGTDGDLFVAYRGIQPVYRFEGSSGALIGAFTQPVAGISALAFGPDGDLFVASLNSDDVQRFDGHTGVAKGVFARGIELIDPKDLVFGPDGDLFVSSFGTEQVLRYDGLTGTFIGIAAQGDELRLPFGVAFRPGILGGATVGISSLTTVVCNNKTTRTSVTINASSGETDWNCLAVDLQASAGDRVIFDIQGVADAEPGSPTGGRVLGLETIERVDCVDLTSGQKINKVRLDGSGTGWDCEAAGLVVNPDDIIQMTVRGRTQ